MIKPVNILFPFRILIVGFYFISVLSVLSVLSVEKFRVFCLAGP
jgi:hypothetical protein